MTLNIHDMKNENHYIMIVDDSEHARLILKAILETEGYKTLEAANGAEALSMLRPNIDLVFMDAVMPGMDGFEATRSIRQSPTTWDLPIIMVTALNDKKSRLKAIKLGVNDFVSKPYDRTELRARTATLLKTKTAQDTIKLQKEELEAKVAERTANLQQALCDIRVANNRIQDAYTEAIKRLCNAAEYRDNETGQHIKRVCSYCELLGKDIGLPDEEVKLVKIASAMHDIGKIGIPDNILLKPSKLTRSEREMMQQHTIIGASILSGSDSPLLQAGEIIALSHHEKWDGSGYPQGLAGEDIHLHARICMIADTFDALTSERPYKKAWSLEDTFQLMHEQRGRMYDPVLCDLFLTRGSDILAIQEQYKDQQGSPIPSSTDFADSP